MNEKISWQLDSQIHIYEDSKRFRFRSNFLTLWSKMDIHPIENLENWIVLANMKPCGLFVSVHLPWQKSSSQRRQDGGQPVKPFHPRPVTRLLSSTFHHPRQHRHHQGCSTKFGENHPYDQPPQNHQRFWKAEHPWCLCCFVIWIYKKRRPEKMGVGRRILQHHIMNSLFFQKEFSL